MKYAQGWLAGVDGDRAYLIPFGLSRFAGSGAFTTSGTSYQGIHGDFRLCLAAAVLDLGLPDSTMRSNDWHCHLPTTEVTLRGASGRLSLAYAIIYLLLSDSQLMRPDRLMLSGDVELDGSVKPVESPAAKHRAMLDNHLSFSVFSSAQTVSHQRGTITVSRLSDLAQLKASVYSMQRSVISPELWHFGYQTTVRD
jgi:hypothetical protein